MINNLDYIKVFYYVAKTGSLTKAAEELMVSQPAVSQAVKQLEEELGVRLFVRVARGVRLTSEGEQLYDNVSRGYALMESGVKKIRQMKDLELGEIRIGASDMTLEFYLLSYLEVFHERFPAIKVTVTNAPTPETLKLLKEDKIDFGIVSTPFEHKGECDCHYVREIEDVFVAGRRFFEYRNRTMDLKELEDLPLICLEGNTSTRRYIDSFLEKDDVRIRPEFELATSDMIVQFALRNLGIGCVVKDFARPYVEEGKLFELRFNKIIPKRQFCVVKKSSEPVSYAATQLLDMLLKNQ
ncbi:MAG: LysR family transcriptional regulator [Lachnospiraceae bacterium]|nr:LysR family transcriptional regulator [Lachnospiraceae bacterium]